MTNGALLVGVMLSVVACFSEEIYPSEPIQLNQRQFRRSLSNSGSFSRIQCLDILADEDLLNELTLRRLQRQRLGQLHGGSGLHHGGHIGTPIGGQTGGNHHHHHHPSSSHELVAGGFEQDAAGIVGGQFEHEHEHDHANLDNKKLELGHVNGQFSDIGANDRKVFETDTKSNGLFGGKDKRVRLEEDSNIHDKEGRFEGDLLKAEKNHAILDHDRKSSSGKLAGAGVKHTSGSFLGAKSNN